MRGNLGLLLVAALTSSACAALHNLSPERRLQDHVYMLNDEARWGRVDMAAMRCTPEYRGQFVARHREWGRGVRIGDADITNIVMGDPQMSSLVTYSWIDEHTMEVAESVVRQDWRSEGEGFKLVGEEVLSGAAEVFAAPAEGESDTPAPSSDTLAQQVAVTNRGERTTRVDAQGVAQR